MSKVIEGLENLGHGPHSIAQTLIQASLKRKLEMSEIRYLIKHYPNGKIVESACGCPDRNVNDLIYRLLEFPSKKEILAFAERESVLQSQIFYGRTTKMSGGDIKNLVKQTIIHTYNHMIGKLTTEPDGKENKENDDKKA